MFKWSVNDIIDATGGRKMGNCNWTHSPNISIDTRNIKKGDIFIAIKGQNFDGHDFLHEAFSKGAVVAIVSKNKYEHKEYPLIVTNNTLEALHNLASYYIKNALVNAKIIAITGSVGKTTTKDMLYAVLSQHGISHTNEGNLNNNIGLPLTILKAPINCQYLILEMGMNKAGEIKELSEISNPDIAVITNIEPAHAENFSSTLDIAKAKLEVLHGMKNNRSIAKPVYDEKFLGESQMSTVEYSNVFEESNQVSTTKLPPATELCKRSNGTLILNRDSNYYDYLSSNSSKNIITFGKHQEAMVRLLDLTRNNNRPLGINLKIAANNQIIDCHLNTQGEHFAYSALAVVAVMQSLGIDLSFALENFNITNGRGNILEVKYNGKHVYIIDDSYNASPTAMKAAIKTLSAYSNNRKVALLGDMLELGEESIQFRTELINSIMEYNIDKIYTVGEFMLSLHKLLPENIKGTHFDSSSQLKAHLTNIIQNNDVILVKGSRGMKMDLIIQAILNPNLD
ncbi:MAG: UDP-N-acetylmuramoyl-tripeptide--D-alanyl-D-alanine ligase [Wolbachia endosymbiont of Ctenocephalides orientis wCori]|nr:MAG: UDP-N-acetylmuramoyl-tripeptide--D-alanyl-D-alanine ligase [Wolbachia endosymbiont of Ctenocephalides orientis wCori]